jgi:hypothetical protein
MGRRLPAALCGGRAATRVRRKRVQRATYSSPSSKLPAPALPSSDGGKAGSAAAAGGGGGCYVNGNGALMVEVGSSKKGGGGRRVMVLADGRAEAAGALQWALSQAVRSNDTVVLLAVAKPVARDGRSRRSLSYVSSSRRAVGDKFVSFFPRAD